MRTNGFAAGGLILMAGMAHGLTTDDYYSVQNGYWDDTVVWTSPVPAAYGYPRAGDRAYVSHELWVTTEAACAEAAVTGTLDLQAPGQLEVFGDAVFSRARVRGTGFFRTWGQTRFTGTTSRIDAPWYNAGAVEFADTPSLQLENDFYNLSGATTLVNNAEFQLFGTTTYGRVRNQGRFHVRSWSTATVDRLQNEGGFVYVGTASLLRVKGHYETNRNGTWHMAAGSVFQPVVRGTAYYDGVFTSVGSGRWQMQTGVLYCGHDSSTDTVFDVGGGGFDWQGGTLDAYQDSPVVNQGAMTVDSDRPRYLDGTLVNRGRLIFGGTATSLVVQGTGRIVNRGTWAITGAPTSVWVPIDNYGDLVFHSATTRVESLLVNAPGATARVESAACVLAGTTDDGAFQNEGEFRIGAYMTCTVRRLVNRGGHVYMGTAAVLRAEGQSAGGRPRTNFNGTYQLESGAVFHPVDGGTAYYDGTFVSSGAGAWQMDTGTLMASYYSTTTTALSVDGGGFRAQGGVWNVRSSHALENRGRLHFASTSGPVTLQGNFRNAGWVTYGTSSPCLFTGPGGRIVNAATGVWNFVDAGGTIENLTSGFDNYGQVNFQGTTVALNSAYNNLPGGTTALQRGQASFPNGCVVQGGTLQFDGGSAEGNVYQVGMAASRLCGTGAISGYVYQDYGTVAPGHSPGALAVGGRYEQGANAALEIELGGKTPGTGYDQLHVGGNASLKGTLNVELYDGYVPAAGQRFDVVRSVSVSNAFKATNLPALAPGTDWLLLYRTNGVQLRVASTADADGDGLIDDWEITHFGDVTSHDGGEEDSDDDRYTDYVEQCLDTQPTNNADFLQVGEIALSGSNSLVALRTGSLAWYAIEARPDLSDPVGQWSVVDEFFGTGGEIVRTNAASGDLRFYRLRATTP